MIGLILTRDFSNPVFARRVEVVEKQIKQHGYRMQLAFTEGDPDMEASCVRQMQADAVEGLIMGPVYEALDLQQHKHILKGQLPVVLFGGTMNSGYDEVGTHPDASIHLSVKHLLAMGHKRVGFLGAPTPRTPEGPSRLFEQYLIDAGLKKPGPIIWAPDTCRYDDYFEVSQAFVQQWQNMSPRTRPTAMLCHNDQMAMTAIAACHEVGIRVPKDLSLIGYENAPGSKYLIPALTTIDNRGDEQMKQAFELLMERLKNPLIPSQKRVIYPELIERASVSDIR
jgi:DNA-binding LacI/PurR family transcriptional regulator